jgi:magnesium transporter
MVPLLKKLSRKAGAPPGTVAYVGPDRKHAVTVNVIDYDAESLRQLTDVELKDALPFRDSETVSWIDISGVHDVEPIQLVGSHFNVHPLILEDIANTGTRPKIEEQDGLIAVIMKMQRLGDEGDAVSEQVSLVIGPSTVISFQEQPGDVFDAVRDRIRGTTPRVRFMTTDYLAYALMDAIVDNYFAILEDAGQRIEDLEDRLVANPDREDLETIHDLKRDLLLMRRRVWPLREVVGGLLRSESPLVRESTRPYLRDLYEHVVQVIDTVETFRDMASGLLDIYLSSVSNRMNEVMKVLTIIATIFIPLGFLAGVYGMNFDTTISDWNMPELGLPFGYIMFWVIALLIGGGLFAFFKRKGWL